MEQRSDEWFEIRRGKITSSRIADMLARTKSGWGASRARYKSDLIIERLVGVTVDTFKSAAMLEGIEMEPRAVEAYEFYQCERTSEVAFVQHPTIEMAGASPDRLVESGGLLEVKCPQPKAHWEILVARKIPGDYLKQMLWQLACAPERTFNDFVSYNDKFPAHLSLYCQRVQRKEHAETIAEMEAEAIKFLAEIEKEMAIVEKHFPPPPELHGLA